jgi:hypothetical protein
LDRNPPKFKKTGKKLSFSREPPQHLNQIPPQTRSFLPLFSKPRRLPLFFKAFP